MPDLAPEQRARQQIEAQLITCGWAVQDYMAADFSAGPGIALREAPLKSGTCEYLLLDRKAVGIIEAKKEGTLLSGVAEQSEHYVVKLPKFKMWSPIIDTLDFCGREKGRKPCCYWAYRPLLDFLARLSLFGGRAEVKWLN